MTEFSPPEALLAQNEHDTTEMRLAAWSHREHIKPIMVKMFVAAARYAVELRTQKIDEIEAIGVKQTRFHYMTLNDGSELTISDLLHFPLHRSELPVHQAGIPAEQQLAREYTVNLRVGSGQLRHGVDAPLQLTGIYDDGDMVGRQIFGHVAQKNAVPEVIKITENITTGFGTIDELHDPWRGRGGTISTDSYYLKTWSWIPNLSKFGHPEVELPKITEIAFSWDSSTGKNGGIDKYGTTNGDRTECARRLARLTEIAGRFLDLDAISDEEVEPLKAIASASQ